MRKFEYNLNVASMDSSGTRLYVTMENKLINNTIEILDEEKQSVLTEVLKCDICLELPRGKQVKICEMGHHFCYTCHNKMKVCGICRGKLLESRNFVVEELVTKLGPILGIPKSILPSAKPPFRLSAGSYPCLHGCCSKMPAYHVLPHLRLVHSSQLTDNLRSNPYTQRFSFTCCLSFVENEKLVHSVRVCDMGLFTLEFTFSCWDFFGCVRVMGDENAFQQFRHQLVVKIPSAHSKASLEFALTGAPLSSYSKDTETVRREGNGLKVNGTLLFENISAGSKVTVFFSVWESNQNSEREETSIPSIASAPKRFLHFQSDRKINRNKNRNARRKRLKEKLKASAVHDGNSETLAKRVSNLVL